MRNEKLQRTLNQSFCQICQKTVELKTLDESGEILKANLNEIKFLAEHHHLHRLNNSLGVLRICAESLYDLLFSRPTMEFDSDIFKTNPSSSNIYAGSLGD